MDDHMRLSLTPTRNAERAYRIEYQAPEDIASTVYRGDENDSANVKR
jgi:hypothetical protein